MPSQQMAIFAALAMGGIIARASQPIDFSWKLDAGNLALRRHSRLEDANFKEDGPQHIITADWLRERCSSSMCVDTSSLQPLHDPHRIDAVQIEDVQEVESFASESGSRRRNLPRDWARAPMHINALRITFSDNTTSNFGVDYLLREIEDHGPAPMQGMKVQFPPIATWDSTLITPPVFSYEHLKSSYVDDLTRQLISVGIALIDDVPRTENFCTDFGSQLSTVRETEWGRVFNVKTVPDQQQDSVKKDLAYTSFSIGMHTDNPYRDPMPDIQILHQIDGCTCPQGGPPCDTCATQNLFSDGFAVAAKLYEEDHEAFDLLSTINVRWENNGGDGKAMVMAFKPTIEVDYTRMVDGKCRPSRGFNASSDAGQPKKQQYQHIGRNLSNSSDIIDCITAIRHSAKSGGYAPLLAPEIASKFYSARRKFSAMLAAEENLIRVYLEPGQLVIFNNKRVLHSRSEVISDRPRWLQGCYLNLDGLYYKLTKSQFSDPLPKYTALENATKSDFEAMGQQYTQYVDNVVVETLFKMMEQQIGKRLGQPVDLFQHNIQTASRAYRAGEDVDVIVMSLFHDITETIVAKNHGGAAAGFLEPYLSPKVIWMLRHHEVFQGYYYFHYFGANRDERERFSDSEHYDDLVRWCQVYDQASFDPNYPELPQKFFVPMVREVFSRQAFWWDPSHPARMAVTGAKEQGATTAHS
jgi:predicted HD phosphohydrolase